MSVFHYVEIHQSDPSNRRVTRFCIRGHEMDPFHEWNISLHRLLIHYPSYIASGGRVTATSFVELIRRVMYDRICAVLNLVKINIVSLTIDIGRSLPVRPTTLSHSCKTA